MDLRAGIASGLILFAGAVSASPPLPDDLSLSMRVVSTTDPAFQVGTHAVLSFEVGQHGPTDREGTIFLIYNTTTLPDGSDQPIQLTAAEGSACALGATDDQGSLLYTLAQDLPPLNGPIDCLVDLDVLDGAAGGLLLTFTVEVMDPENGYDPTPGNDDVTFDVGYSAPEPTPFFTPVVEPATPTIADDVRWVAQWDGCGALGDYTVTNWGNFIEVRYPVERICGVPIGPIGAGADLGQLAAGHYTVHVEPCDVGFFLFGGPCWLTESPPDVEFVVAGASPPVSVALPTLEDWSELVLAIALSIVAVGSIRIRSRDP